MQETDHDFDEESRAGVRVMVAIGISPNSDRLLRRAAKLAEGLHGQLFAIHVHPPGSGTNVYEANVRWHLDQARQLGAHVEIVNASDVAATLVQAARKHDVTHLVIGQSDISRWQEAMRGSIVNRILRFRSGIDIYIVTDPGR
jgi:two-component system, OmpR family, sensor histidine kinase KdpD